MVAKASQNMTLIVTKQWDFKQHTVNVMNSIGFPAEKLFIDSVDDIALNLTGNPRLVNVVIDAKAIDDLNKQFDILAKVAKTRPDVMFLLVVNEEEKRKLQHNDHGLANVFIRMPPYQKPDLNDIFYKRNRAGNGGGVFVGSFPGAVQKVNKDGSPVTPPGGASPTAQKNPSGDNVSAFEASAHVRNTIEQINQLASDKTNLEALSAIGQRFNGIIGAFAFLANKDGYRELCRLSLMIDDIARTYEAPEVKPPITDPHYNLLLSCAKCAYKVLQKLRDNETIHKELIALEAALFKQYDVDITIHKRDQKSQIDIDDFINQVLS